jgi:hypothetical protein
VEIHRQGQVVLEVTVVVVRGLVELARLAAQTLVAAVLEVR